MLTELWAGLGCLGSLAGIDGYHSSLPLALMGPMMWHTAERSQGPSHGMLSGVTAAARLPPFLTITVPRNCDPHTST